MYHVTVSSGESFFVKNSSIQARDIDGGSAVEVVPDIRPNSESSVRPTLGRGAQKSTHTSVRASAQPAVQSQGNQDGADASGEEWKVPDHDAGGLYFGRMKVTRLRLSNGEDKEPITLLSTLLREWRDSASGRTTGHLSSRRNRSTWRRGGW